MRRGLYAILDLGAVAARGLEVEPVAHALLAARPAALQLRAKEAGAGELLRLVRALAPAARAAGVPLFVNDRVDVAVLGGADGVHVGQGDVPPPLAQGLARRWGVPVLALGVSTHSARELETALAGEASLAYVAFGPVFATRTKTDAEPVVGLPALAAAAALASRHGVPLVAIGGIDPARAGAVAAAGAHAGAVVSALLEQPHRVTERARELHAALGGGD